MPAYRIHRLRESHRQQFRWAPHTCGATTVKRRDYEDGGLVEAATPYAAWAALRQSERPLDVGDVLEFEDGSLRIFKYVGFEEAVWFVPVPEAADSAGGALEPAPEAQNPV